MHRPLTNRPPVQPGTSLLEAWLALLLLGGSRLGATAQPIGAQAQLLNAVCQIAYGTT